METKDRNISDLIPAEYNPRWISDDALEQLKASIQRFDTLEPIIVNTHPDRKDIIISGHQLDRTCYGMELDPKYCQVIVDRMLKLDPSLEVKINGELYNNSEKTVSNG